MDVAPEAIVCTNAKLAAATLEGIEAYLDNLRVGRPSIEDVPEDVKVFFTTRLCANWSALIGRLKGLSLKDPAKSAPLQR